jgi:hypothetical protein
MAPATAAAIAAVQSQPQPSEAAAADEERFAAEQPSEDAKVVAIPVAAPAKERAEPPADAEPDAASASTAAEGEASTAAEDGAPPAEDGPPTEEGPAAGPEQADSSDGAASAASEGAATAAGAASASPPAAVPPGEGLATAAAVPLAIRRVPIAEPSGTAPASTQARAAPPSPLELLRAEPAAGDDVIAEFAGPPGSGAVAPSTAAGARSSRYPPAPPVRVTALAGAEATIRAPGRSAPGLEETEPVRPRDGGTDDGYEEPPRSFSSTLRLLAAAIVIVAVLIFIATRIFGSGTGTPSSQTTHTHTGGGAPAAHAPAAASITVAVLNGTGTSHLASGAWGRLAQQGFRRHGAIANAPSAGVTRSVVGYTAHHRAAALEVARDLSLSAAHVRPVGRASLLDAEHNGRTPQVVVTLGSDYAGR